MLTLLSAPQILTLTSFHFILQLCKLTNQLVSPAVWSSSLSWRFNTCGCLYSLISLSRIYHILVNIICISTFFGVGRDNITQTTPQIQTRRSARIHVAMRCDERVLYFMVEKVTEKVCSVLRRGESQKLGWCIEIKGINIKQHNAMIRRQVVRLYLQDG